MIKEKDTFKQACDQIDTIKDKLFQIVYELEEAGYVRKAKSLDTLIGKLEALEHTGK